LRPIWLGGSRALPITGAANPPWTAKAENWYYLDLAYGNALSWAVYGKRPVAARRATALARFAAVGTISADNIVCFYDTTN